MLRVLLVTPDLEQGRQWKQICEAGQNIQVALSATASEALAEVVENYYSIAVLDADLQDMNAAELGQALLAWFGKIQLVALVPKGGWMDDRLSKLQPQAVLEKPFTGGQLRELINRLLASTPAFATSEFSSLGKSIGSDVAIDQDIDLTPIPESRAQATSEIPAWLEDVNRLAQHLTRLTFSSAAKASLITSTAKLWAYAGELPQPAAQELANNVMHYWSRYGGKDLARFVRLESTGDEYLLYATGLENKLVLALAFETGVPFSQIRTQASVFAKALADAARTQVEPAVIETFPAALPASGVLSTTPPPETEGWIEKVAWTEEQGSQKTSSTPVKQEAPSGKQAPLAVQAEDTASTLPDDWQPGSVTSQGRQAYLEDLLDDSPPERILPDATVVSPALPVAKPVSQVRDGQQQGPSPEIITRPSSATAFEPPGSVTKPVEPPAFRWQAVPAPGETSDLETGETRPTVAQPFGQPESFEEESAAGAALPTEAIPARSMELESVSAAMYNLLYTCVLIPRFPHHHLTGDLAAHLSEWVPQICVAFGWRVEHISVRPTYLQWMVNVSPSTSPGYLMRIIRKITSQRIFVEFPRLKSEILSEDYWAPGYLIVSSPNSPPHQVIHNYITQMRKRQGLSGR